MTTRERGPGRSQGTPRVDAIPTVSGLEVHVVARELSALVGSYISSIHGLGEAQLLRMRRSVEGAEESKEAQQQGADLVLSPKFGAWVTRTPAHTVTGRFTTSLRGELLRRRLEAVSQQDMDRIVVLTLSGREEKTVRLILEMMPPGNIILTDDGGRVILALREWRGGARTIARGRTYVPPVQTRSSPDKVDEATLTQSLRREKTVGAALGRGVSLPRKYVDEVLSRAALSQDEPASRVSPEKTRELLAILKEMVGGLDSPSPALVERSGRIELLSVPPGPGGIVVESAPTMTEMMDKTFTPILLEEAERSPEGEVVEDQESRRVNEMEVTLERLDSQARELEERSATLRRLAAMVRSAADLKEVQALLRDENRRDTQSEESKEAISSHLYDEAKGYEAELERIREVQKGLRTQLERRRDRPASAASRVKVVARKKKEWYEKFRWFFTTEGRLAIGGRDAQSNGTIVKKYAEAGDTIYHADLFGSPFFVLKGGKEQTPEECRQVARATATFSSAWKTGLAAADAYWVEPDQVSTSAPSGEFLASGSFVIRGKKNFLTKNAIEVSIGIDERGRIVAGPEESVRKSSPSYLVLIPHREKPSDTAKKVLFELGKLSGNPPLGVTVDDVLRAMPPGGGKIIRRKATVQTGSSTELF